MSAKRELCVDQCWERYVEEYEGSADEHDQYLAYNEEAEVSGNTPDWPAVSSLEEFRKTTAYEALRDDAFEKAWEGDEYWGGDYYS
jgi:hypothetical protein